MCADVASLEDVLRQPADPEIQKRLGATTELLAQAKALRDSGKFPDALTLGVKAVAQADEIKYPPLQGEAHLLVGRLHSDLGDTKSAEHELLTALAHAERGRDDRTRALVAIVLVWVLGVTQDQHDAAARWEKVAYGILDRIGGDTDLQLTLLNHHGGVLFAQSKIDELLVHQKHYIAAHEKHAGPTHPETILATLNYGSALAIHGDYVEALEAYARASALFEQTMGPRYYRGGLARNNMADILTQQGHAVKALPMAEEAIVLIESARGPAHKETIAAQFTISAAILRSGDPARALAFVEERLASWRKVLGPESPLLAEGIVTYARILRARGEHAKAIAVLDETIALLRKQQPTDAIVAALLAERGECLLELDRASEAVPILSEAVELGTKLHLRPVWLAEAKFALARAVRATKGDPVRAAALAQETLVVFERAGINRARDVSAWLAVSR